MTQHRRAEDESAMIWLRDKVLPPILIAGVLGGLGGGLAMYQKIASVSDSIPKIDAELARLNDKQLRLENELTVVRSQMIGWDVMKRIEMGLNSASKEGKGNQAMASIASVIRAEIEARKEKP